MHVGCVCLVWASCRLKVHTLGNAVIRLKRKVLPLPWWFVLVGYAIALAAVGTCVYFIVVFGAILGETLATQWLIAMVVGTLESVVVEQPLKVRAHYLTISSRRAFNLPQTTHYSCLIQLAADEY